MTTISAFDLDGTLLRGSSSFAFAKYLRKQGVFSWLSFFYVLYFIFQYHCGAITLHTLHQRAFQKLFYQRKSSDIHQLARSFVKAHLENLLYAPAYQQMLIARQKGALIVILSSSPEFLVRPIADALGVDSIFSTQYGVDKDGCFCEITRVVLGETKADYLQALCREKACALQDTTAYSDSHEDLDFLAVAGRAIAVNPNAQLRAISKQRDWKIL